MSKGKVSRMETITVSVVQDDDVYISHCLDYDIASQGSTKQEAIDNIKEAVSLFLEVGVANGNPESTRQARSY